MAMTFLPRKLELIAPVFDYGYVNEKELNLFDSSKALLASMALLRRVSLMSLQANLYL